MSEVLVARWSEIEAVLPGVDLLTEMERAFCAYSAGQCVVPPVGELLFDDPPGDVHLKYGYVRGEETYVVKIASGFYANAALGLPSSQGLMLLFRQTTGEPLAVLLDEGRLTDLRTAAAGALAARTFAPKNIECIGVLGTGIQARRQVEALQDVTDCRRVLAWARHEKALSAYRAVMENKGFEVLTTTDPDELGASCSLIVTTTPATTALISEASIRPGTHITAVGSDTADKQELEAALLRRADLVVGDSRSQCRERGEISQAVRDGALGEDEFVELGEVLAGKCPGRTDADQITVCDLTGVAVQDVAIASAVYRALTSKVRK